MKNFSQINLQTENGEKTFNVLLNFFSEEHNKNFLVVVDQEAEANGGQVAVTPLSYEADAEGNVLSVSEIETRDEFELIKRRFEEELQSQHAHQCCGGTGENCACSHDHDHDHDDHACGCGHDCACQHE